MHARSSIAAVAVTVAAALGCKSEPAAPTYKDDVQAMCDSFAKSGAPGMAVDPPQKFTVAAEWLVKNLKTEQGKKFFGSVVGGASSPAARGKLLRDEATKEGIAPCGLADEWDAAAKLPPKPAPE
jgi:hypothetical protein